MKRFIAIIPSLLLAVSAAAAAFNPGLVVVQVGAGSGALAGTATAAFLQEFAFTGGLPVQTIALPTAVSGANQILTLSGTSTSEGFLSLSANGLYLTLGGYNQAVGNATSTSLGNRTVGRIDMLGNVDTTTILGDVASIGNIRSVVSDSGLGFWAGSSSGGMRYTTFGSTGPSTQLNSAAPTNLRVANIFAGLLYASAASGTFQGVATLGSGLPTTAGQTPSLLSGFPTAAGPSSYDYLFASPSILYVADDRTTASGGGLQKWTLSGSTWSLAYTLNSGLTAGLRGLTAVDDGVGNEVFYATTADAITALAGNKLVSITDLLSATTLPGSETFTTLATAAGNTAFRGVEVVPEPSTIALTGMGLLASAVFRRIRRN